MKKGLVWKIVLAVGIVPFVYPFASYLYQLWISTRWTLTEWLILYSYVYWPTYLVGLVLTVISLLMLRRK